MAFLDNSGDIILDAVLTGLGRKRLAEGNYQITKFGCPKRIRNQMKTL